MFPWYQLLLGPLSLAGLQTYRLLRELPVLQKCLLQELVLAPQRQAQARLQSHRSIQMPGQELVPQTNPSMVQGLRIQWLVQVPQTR